MKKFNSTSLIAKSIVSGMVFGTCLVSAGTLESFSYTNLGSGSEVRTELSSSVKAGDLLAQASKTTKATKSTKATEKAQKPEGKGKEGKCGEGKCGEGKCGNKDKKANSQTKNDDTTKSTKAKEAKSPEGKCGEGKCGAE